MKKILYIFVCFLSITLFSQQNENPFSQAEKDELTHEQEGITTDNNMSSLNDNPANPGAPIDDYIPILIAAAVALIVLKKYKRTSVG